VAGGLGNGPSILSWVFDLASIGIGRDHDRPFVKMLGFDLAHVLKGFEWRMNGPIQSNSSGKADVNWTEQSSAFVGHLRYRFYVDMTRNCD
jgi:hypothetical protein